MLGAVEHDRRLCYGHDQLKAVMLLHNAKQILSQECTERIGTHPSRIVNATNGARAHESNSNSALPSLGQRLILAARAGASFR